MSLSEQTYWKKCSECKKSINFGARYYRCNVSTCNRPRTALHFCSVSCWEPHTQILRHRDSWAEEFTAPSKETWLKDMQSIPAESATPSAARSTSQANSDEILVVVSKLKEFIRVQSNDMNTSADVMPFLSDRLRRLCEQAIIRARGEGRKTVMARDFV